MIGLSPSAARKLRILLKKQEEDGAERIFTPIQNDMAWVSVGEGTHVALYDAENNTWDLADENIRLVGIDGVTITTEGTYLSMRWGEDANGIPVYVTWLGEENTWGLIVEGGASFSGPIPCPLTDDMAGNGLDLDDCTLNVVTSCPLKIDDDGAVTLDPDAIGDGLELVEDVDGCTLQAKISCGLETVDGATRVKASDLAGSGLVTEGSCGLAVSAGPGISVTADQVQFNASDAAGSGLVAETATSLAVNPGTGISITADAVTFKASDAAGSGLVAETATSLAVNVSCGLEISSDAVRVKSSDLAGPGLTTTGTCALQVNPGQGLQVVNDEVKASIGCGLQFDAEDQIAVLPSDLAGLGIAVGDDCELEIDTTEVDGPTLTALEDITFLYSATTVYLQKTYTVYRYITTPAGLFQDLEVVESYDTYEAVCLLRDEDCITDHPPDPPDPPDPPGCAEVTPDIFSDDIAYFNGAGNYYDPGNYTVTFVKGALSYNKILSPPLQWFVNYSYEGNGAYYEVVHSGGLDTVNAPGNTVQYPTPAACQNANAGDYVTFWHNGGTIGVRLIDLPYTDNARPDKLSGIPAPTFKLCYEETDCKSVTPDVMSGTVSWFDSGANYPAGNYTIRYIGGAMSYNTVGHAEWYINHPYADAEYRIKYNDGAAEVQAPGDEVQYADANDCSDANYGANVTITHTGGKIGVYLLDAPDPELGNQYVDNGHGPYGDPTFEICVEPDHNPRIWVSGDVVLEGEGNFNRSHVAGELTGIVGDVLLEGEAAFNSSITRGELTGIVGDVVLEGEATIGGSHVAGELTGIVGDVVLEGEAGFTYQGVGGGSGFVQSKSATDNGGPMPGTTSISITWTSSTTTGNLLVAVLGSPSTAGSFSAPSGWTLAGSLVQNTPNNYQTAIYYKENAASQSSTGNFSTPSDTTAPPFSVAVGEFSGIVTSSSLDKTANAMGTSGTFPMDNSIPSGTTATTAQANELLIVGLGIRMLTGSTGTLTNSFTQAEKTSSGTQFTTIILGYKEVTSTGTYSSAAQADGKQYACAIATFKKV